MGLYGRSIKQDETRHKPHVKKGDTVRVLSGKDRGKQGRVLRVNATKGTAIVERVNFTKKHTKPNPGKNVQGGILERESPINVAKLQVVCPSCNEPARLGSHRNEEGEAQRFCRKCKADLGK
ncbi:MAG: 50S ribosomal protein L24 [Acidobacteria bacterium]|nr:50S ribosomal protein L24 [Acidobacteriota bacterium]MBV9475548.1 50S ribosomal protein L24 [Acidobacteriota bacterium]